jgi:hypothetical protein
MRESHRFSGIAERKEALCLTASFQCVAGRPFSEPDLLHFPFFKIRICAFLLACHFFSLSYRLTFITLFLV